MSGSKQEHAQMGNTRACARCKETNGHPLLSVTNGRIMLFVLLGTYKYIQYDTQIHMVSLPLISSCHCQSVCPLASLSLLACRSPAMGMSE